jgi:hypothetical protein
MAADKDEIAADTLVSDGTTESDGGDQARADPTPPDNTASRLAFWVFAAYLAVAVPVLIALGRNRWFFADEWTMLSGRSATNIGDLLRPYNQHWTSFPILVYQGLFAVFGLHSYVPYQLPVILLHLTTAGLLRVIMRRAGVNPWVATVAAGTFVLFGPGLDNILWASQIGFTVSMVLGLTQMILSDHDGPWDRRDWLGLAAGGLALCSSGQAPALIFATGLAVLSRRGWRPAAYHTVPLGLVYSVWYVTQDPTLASLFATTASRPPPPFHLSDYVGWMRSSTIGLFTSLGHFPIIAVGLAGVLVVGWVLAVKTLDRSTLRRRAAMPGALLIGLVVAASATAPQRFFAGPDEAQASRYLGIYATMALPALAFATDAILRRWWRAGVAVLALFLIPIPWNVSVLVQRGSSLGEPGMTLGWLLDAERAGKLPAPGPPNAVVASQLPVRLGVARRAGPTPGSTSCHNHTQGMAVSPHQGDLWVMHSPVRISLAKNGSRAGFPVVFVPTQEKDVLEVEASDLDLFLEPVPPSPSYEICM